MAMKSLQSFLSLRLLAILGLLLFIVRNAWVDEDACVTYRAISNFVAGFGPSFNIDERVQAFTHPLWFFVCTLFHLVTRDVLLSSVLASTICSIFALWALLGRIPATVTTLVFATITLGFSQAFMHYSTSGLENSLSHLLFGAFFLIWIGRGEWSGGRTFSLSLIAALSAINRLDSILFFLPPLAYIALSRRSCRTVAILAAGFAPLALWLAFSLLYYGFAFPNTYYAKLSTDIPKAEVYRAGLNYFSHSLRTDPTTLTTITLALICGVVRREARTLITMAGIALYLIYVVTIGGDYMSGRFFSVALYGAVCVLSTFTWSVPKTFAFLATIVVASFLFGRPPILVNAETGKGEVVHESVVDKQLYYYQSQGYPLISKGFPYPLRRDMGPKSVTFVFGVNIGATRTPFEDHIVDDIGLVDPLIARLPSRGHWRPGHFQRDIPLGYGEVLRGERLGLCDTELERFRQYLNVLTKEPIWSIHRLRTIVEMNLGLHDRLINKTFYKDPITQLPLTDFNATSSDNSCEHLVPSRGVKLKLAEVSHGTKLSIEALEGERFFVKFLSNNTLIAQVEFGQRTCDGFCDALVPCAIDVPAQSRERGFDTLWISPLRRALNGDQRIGRVTIIDK
jgi:arabinofuranosyltransferase